MNRMLTYQRISLYVSLYNIYDVLCFCFFAMPNCVWQALGDSRLVGSQSTACPSCIGSCPEWVKLNYTESDVVTSRYFKYSCYFMFIFWIFSNNYEPNHGKPPLKHPSSGPSDAEVPNHLGSRGRGRHGLRNIWWTVETRHHSNPRTEESPWRQRQQPPSLWCGIYWDFPGIQWVFVGIQSDFIGVKIGI